MKTTANNTLPFIIQI